VHALILPRLALQVALIVFWSFAIPNVNADYAIPAARRISWYPAGLDVVGGIRTSFRRTTTIRRLHPDGSVDDSGTINAAIAAARPNTLLTIPAGTYLIRNDIIMKSGVVLRGAQACLPPWLPAANGNATTLLMSNGTKIFFNGGYRENSWMPRRQSGRSIMSGYTQGSASLTLASVVGLSAGDYICVYQNKDTAAIDDKGYTWLGEDSGPDPHVWAQYTKITNIAGNVITIDPPLYQVTPNPTGQSVRKQTFGVSMAGLENMRLYGDNTNYRMIWLRFSQFCWIKGVETYDVGANSSGSPHVWTEFCYANEYRRNYFHHGAGHDSGANYGIEFYHWNSRHKVEDNIVRETRHSIVFEGGGTGCVVLYNYTDDNWESVQGQPTTRDASFLSEDQVGNHGAHPYMNLWEGNWAACWWGDYTQGSSSYITAFRNSFSGKQTSYSLTNPWLWSVIEVETYNRYFNLIGNIVGNPTMIGGTVINNGGGGPLPTMFRFGYSSAGGSHTDSLPYSTVILHGNYDFVSDSIHDWASPDHTLPISLYYPVRPAFFGNLAWPPYNSTSPTINGRERIPAGYRFVNGADPPPLHPHPTASPTPAGPSG
jgi:hypothetical protein